MTEVINWLVVIAAGVATLYAVLYAFRPWWTTDVGKAMFIKALANMLLLDMIVVRRLFGEQPWRETVILVGIVLLLIGLTWLLVALLRTPRIPPD